MRSARAWGWLIVASISACGDSAATPDAPLGIDANFNAKSGTVIDDQTSEPIANANVCLLDQTAIPCSITDSSGVWELEVPPSTTDQDLTILTTANGYLGDVFLVQNTPTGFSIFAGTAMRSDVHAMTLLATQAQFTYPDTTRGFIRAILFDNIDGATATIAPASGSGPIYTDPNGVPNPSRTSTSIDGTIYFGNVTPGPFTLTVTAPGKTCSVVGNGLPPVGAWPPIDGSTARGRVISGAITDEVRIHCD